MRAKYVGNKPDRIIHVCRNGDVSQIPRGTPVSLQIGATANENDGMNVVLPGTAGANAQLYAYGVSTTSLGPGDDGEVVMFGIVTGTVQKVSRTASTVSWPSAASVAKGIVKIDTANNQFVAGVASDGTMFVLLDDVPAIAGSASNTSDARLSITQGGRVFVRAL